MLLLLAGAAWGADKAASQLSVGQCAAIDERAIVHRSPGEDTEVVGHLEHNAAVEITQVEGDWLRIDNIGGVAECGRKPANREHAWIHKQYLQYPLLVAVDEIPVRRRGGPLFLWKEHSLSYRGNQAAMSPRSDGVATQVYRTGESDHPYAVCVGAGSNGRGSLALLSKQRIATWTVPKDGSLTCRGVADSRLVLEVSWQCTGQLIELEVRDAAFDVYRVTSWYERTTDGQTLRFTKPSKASVERDSDKEIQIGTGTPIEVIRVDYERSLLKVRTADGAASGWIPLQRLWNRTNAKKACP